MVRVRVPATTANLGPGFDCLGMAVELFNYIQIGYCEKPGVSVETVPADDSGLFDPATLDDLSSVPQDERNLVYKAAARLLTMAGKPATALQLRVEIGAPLARGLGSSASAIAGGLFAANELAGRPLSMNDLVREATAMEGHPDNVVPCLVGGLTSSLCLGSQVLVERREPAANVRCVFFIPDYQLETATARGVMPSRISMADAVFNASRIPFVLSRMASGDLTDLDQIMDDRLHQPYRIPLVKGYEAVQVAAMEAGAAAVCISGAGPTILAVCREDTAASVARAGLAALKEIGIGAITRVVRPDANGCQIIG